MRGEDGHGIHHKLVTTTISHKVTPLPIKCGEFYPVDDDRLAPNRHVQDHTTSKIWQICMLEMLQKQVHSYSEMLYTGRPHKVLLWMTNYTPKWAWLGSSDPLLIWGPHVTAGTGETTSIFQIWYTD